MISIKIQKYEKLIEKKSAFQAKRLMLLGAIGKTSIDFAWNVVATAKRDYLTGPRPERLGVVTGRLRASIGFRTSTSRNDISLFFGTDVPYAPIHEFGGTTGRNHNIVIRKRPFLRPAVQDNLELFKEKLRQTMWTVIHA